MYPKATGAGGAAVSPAEQILLTPPLLPTVTLNEGVKVAPPTQILVGGMVCVVLDPEIRQSLQGVVQRLQGTSSPSPSDREDPTKPPAATRKPTINQYSQVPPIF